MHLEKKNAFDYVLLGPFFTKTGRERKREQEKRSWEYVMVDIKQTTHRKKKNTF